eukprot:NODE_926_length_1553_cov_53.137447_g915_i0.p2 GENE.NODE_926_length_1553_cov_53.137447_g915_i0~~NODE_926_length_1553_cov_53.137447_g915_i0.p2  ORF type:complete len:184 (+),score=1.48 NODE_926_length_1553_cov_53.137447_g915_i0:811-1362(+)
MGGHTASEQVSLLTQSRSFERLEVRTLAPNGCIAMPRTAPRPGFRFICAACTLVEGAKSAQTSQNHAVPLLHQSTHNILLRVWFALVHFRQRPNGTGRVSKRLALEVGGVLLTFALLVVAFGVSCCRFVTVFLCRFVLSVPCCSAWRVFGRNADGKAGFPVCSLRWRVSLRRADLLYALWHKE